MLVKPDHMKDKDWIHWTTIGLGPCVTCGAVSHYNSCDMLEVTKPEDRVINYKVIKVWQFCEEHRREGWTLNRDGTVTVGGTP